MSTTDFDADQLRTRYRAERDKRLRADGNEQYVEIAGDLARYIDDPYVEPITRDPVHEDVEVAVVGGGFGGLLACARLRAAGVRDLRLIEKGGDVGGTWYWNRYPGAACDVESYVYLPLLEEVGTMPTEKYSKAPEILAHSQAIARHFDIYEQALLQTEVTGVRWDDEGARWEITTNRGDTIRARFLIQSNGPLHRPKLPGIPGIESFSGHTFHTSRWDYAYTGGSSAGGLSGLADKRVAIIGTGATAVQCVPHLGEAAHHLFVFQRTPSSIDVRANRPTDEEWAASLSDGWHKHRMDNFNALVSGGWADEDLVMDGWTDIIGNLVALLRDGAAGEMTAESLGETMELADFQKMEQIRARVDAIVEDPATAAALKPWYRQFCKRPCFHDEYLPTFNRPNVTLVDTDGHGVDRITERGIVANGVEHEVDCIIFATGFEVGTAYARRSGYETLGRDGRTLSDAWATGMRSLHGMHVHGFPNCFIMGPAQSGFTVNYPHMLDEQAQHLAYIVGQATTSDSTMVEVTAEAEEAWISHVIERSRDGAKFAEECTPGYYNNEGKPTAQSAQNGPYGGGSLAFYALLAAWRDAGTLDGLTLDGARPA